MNLDHILDLANNSGGTLYGMLALLFIALLVIVERTRYLANMQKIGGEAIALCKSSVEINKKTLQEFHSANAGFPILRLLEIAIKGSKDHLSRDELESSLEEEIMHEVPLLDKSLWILDTVITLAPLLGLFGTILGMFNAFGALTDMQGGLGQITGGIAEALIATASGLVIAMVGLFFFNRLNNKVRQILHQMDTLKTMILNRRDLFKSVS